MKTITITWKVSWSLALLLLILGVFLTSAATGYSLRDSLYILPRAPMGLIATLFPPFSSVFAGLSYPFSSLFWGLAYTDHPNGLPEALFASMATWLAIWLIVAGMIDRLKRK